MNNIGEHIVSIKSNKVIKSGDVPISADIVVPIAKNAFSLSFDEVNDFVDIPHIAAYEMESNTRMCWFKVASDSTVNPKGLFFKSFDTSFGNNSGINVHIGLNGIIQMTDISANGTQVDLRTTQTGFHDDLWHHVAAVVRKNAENDTTWELWVDFTLRDSVNLATNPKFNTEKITLGRVSSSSLASRYLKGNLDEVQLWNIALTQAQISEFGNKTLVGDETGLVGYWNCEDKAADLTDLTVGNNHGTITGAVYSTDVKAFAE